MIRRVVLIVSALLIMVLPAWSETSIEKADAYYQSQDYKKAAKYSRKVLDDDPENIRVRVLLAESYSELGKYEKAIREYKEIIRRQPENMEAAFRLGLVYNKAEYHRNAEDVYRQLLVKDPDNPKFRYRLGISLALCMDLDEAYQEYRKLKRLDKALADDLIKKIYSNDR